MWTIQKTDETSSKIVTIYYTDKLKKFGTTWTTDEREAKIFNTEQEAEATANIGKPIIKPKQ